MRLVNYIMLLLSISIIFYFLGYKAPLLQIIQSQGGTEDSPAYLTASCDSSVDPNCDSIINKVIKFSTSETGTNILIGGAVVTGLVVLLSGFSATYIIPALILMAIMNLLVFPTSILLDPTLPSIIKVPIIAIFNVLLVLAVIDFIRGRS